PHPKAPPPPATPVPSPPSPPGSDSVVVPHAHAWSSPVVRHLRHFGRLARARPRTPLPPRWARVAPRPRPPASTTRNVPPRSPTRSRGARAMPRGTYRGVPFAVMYNAIMGVERREQPRVSIDAFVKVASEDREYVFRTRDVSLTGFFLYTRVGH